MRPMSEFDLDRPAKLHDRLKDKDFDWHCDWAKNYRRKAHGRDDAGCEQIWMHVLRRKSRTSRGFVLQRRRHYT